MTILMTLYNAISVVPCLLISEHFKRSYGEFVLMSSFNQVKYAKVTKLCYIIESKHKLLVSQDFWLVFSILSREAFEQVMNTVLCFVFFSFKTINS